MSPEAVSLEVAKEDKLEEMLIRLRDVKRVSFNWPSYSKRTSNQTNSKRITSINRRHI